MIEVRNKLYTQRFFAKRLSWKDIFQAVTYTQFEGTEKIPWYYKIIHGETSTIDLTKSLDNLVAEFNRNTRNEINRAIKEGFDFEYNEDYRSFVPFYNDFCRTKEIPFETSISTLQKYNKTLITMAKHNGQVLVMHATVVNDHDKEAMLLYSGSQRLDENIDSKKIGWANRFLHFKEFELFKTLGIERYEWNGICTDPEKTDVYNISQFKLSFGSKPKKSIGLRTPLFVLMKKIEKILKTISRNK